MIPAGRVRLIFLLAIVSMLTSIVGLVIVPRSDAGKSNLKIDSRSPARMVFYGPQGGIIDLLGRPSIFVNGVRYARLVRGTYFYIDVPAGRVAACIELSAAGCSTVNAVNGDVYYFRATYTYPLGYDLSRVDVVSGEAERRQKAYSPVPQHLIEDRAVQIDLISGRDTMRIE